MSRRRAGGDPVLLLQVAVAAFTGGMVAVGALTVFTRVDGGSLLGLPVVVAALSVIAVAFLPVHEPPRDPGYPQPAAPLPRREATVPGAPALPHRVVGPEQAAPWWELTAPQSDAGGRSAVTGPAVHPPRWGQAPTPNSASLARPAPEPGHAAPAAGPAPPPVSVAVPVPGTSWWEAASAGPAGTPQPAAPGWNERDTSAAGRAGEATEAAVTRVVQCPRCGDFGVDLRQRTPGFAFACTRCGHQWRWEPGSAWPTAVVRPRRKRQQAPAGPNRPDSRR